MLASCQLRPFPNRSLEVEKVVEENNLPPTEAEFSFAQEQTIAAEAPAVSNDHAFGSALGYLHLGGDGVTLVQNARRRTRRRANQLARIREDRSSRREARTRRVPTCECRVVER